MLSNRPPCTSQVRDIGNCLRRKTLQFLVRLAENLHHCLEGTEVSDRTTDRCILRDLFENFQSSNLTKQCTGDLNYRDRYSIVGSYTDRLHHMYSAQN